MNFVVIARLSYIQSVGALREVATRCLQERPLFIGLGHELIHGLHLKLLLQKTNLEKKMDYRDDQNITYCHRKNKNIALAISAVACLLIASLIASCSSGKTPHSSDEVFKPEIIPYGRLELNYIDNGHNVYTLIWSDESFCFTTYSGDKYNVYLEGKDSIHNITYGNVDEMLNERVLSDLQVEVKCDGKLIKGDRACRIRKYLIAMMLENSPIIPKFQSFFDGREHRSFGYNKLYKYFNPTDWHSVEITLGVGIGDYDFISDQSMKVFKDSLVFNNYHQKKVFPITEQESDSISALLKRINVDGAIYEDWYASGLYGNQIFVDNHMIFQSHPMGLDENLPNVPYKELFLYIESLCPEKFNYDEGTF